MKTAQIERWQNDFGREYTDRNSLSPESLDSLYRKNYGVTRREINQRFLAQVPKNSRVLEVGCNEGNQLCMLREMGFHHLYGIEIQDYALSKARKRIDTAELVKATAFEIPYPDGFFDLVFTSGVLIHIAPLDLPAAISEIYRCAKRWIWGFEYYAPQMTEVVYRGHESLLWKADYARVYLQQFSGLELLREERLRYLENENVDTAFLLERKSPAQAEDARS
ncbi:MAG TPA: pseudaminic acid biosynthesis-associated methylase [Terriglobales bacterium]|jgi:pseudaminic acid biosynthesis-associated methylase|nr:pseudaminic acid biosynthesis-associated methylase [Terriglobales bacterium]